MKTTRMRIPVIHQSAASDCAPAVVAMVARAYGIEVTLAQVRERVDPGRDGVSALVLRDTLRGLGLQCRALRVAPDEVAAAPGNLPTPFIAHWDADHYVVVEGVARGKVSLIDPAVGRRRLDAAEFADHAGGLVFLVAPAMTSAPAATSVRATAPRSLPADSSTERAVVWGLLTRFRGWLAAAAFASALMSLIGLGVPIATARITDRLVEGTFDPTTWLVMAAVLAAGIGGLALARGLLVAAMQHRLARRLTHDVADTLFSRSFRYFERRSVGDLFMRVVSADLIRDMLGVVLVGAVLDVLLTLGYLVVLLVLAPWLALVTAVVLVATLIASVRLAGRSSLLRREELLAGAEADTRMIGAIEGIATLRTTVAERFVLGQWAEHLERRLTLSARRARVSGLSEAVLTMARTGAPVLFLVVAAGTARTPGEAIGVAALAGAVLAPLASLSTQLVLAADLRPMLERIADVTNGPAQESGHVAPGRLTGAVELRDVTFGYDARSPHVLRGVSATIPAGSKVGVIGSTGCGKSTLVSLLCGLHQPHDGSIRYDGQDLRDLDVEAVRRQLGVVLQEPWLGTGTIRDGIVFGREGFTDDDLALAAAKAGVLEEIMAMPRGFDTKLADGRGLSTGQRQRLALARALLGDPSVLILDEATSALDVSTEARVESELRALNMTRIVIAHRLSTVADADLLLVLADGQIVESGSPSELAQRPDGVYARMLTDAQTPSAAAARPRCDVLTA